LPPHGEHGLAASGIVFDPIDRLASQPRGFGDLRNAHRSDWSNLHHLELNTREARLAAEVGPFISGAGLINTGALRGLRGLGPPP
jgi:hypothetical protein